MDLLSLNPNTITIDLKHPATGAPLGVSVELQSLESDTVKAVERALKNKALRGGRNTVTAEKIEDNTIALLSAAIVSWTFSGDAMLGEDKKPACNDANKRKLLSVPAIAKQIDSALGDEAAFFGS
ncbi:hypothetical protein GHK38_03520 [Sinorhizobium meliloti]|uniref:hypothetical protein n=1 Tax=Rhizobium meliloti TaxID=382 RepID=UPI000B4A13A3|nr:hypothetical protein [Sinorhizobium meliloti]ASQ03666.1 hypothetical protein CDO23_06675 [Sinorhizobium meliloti]MDX0276702.1 hypothetical protein [Sinorhizobium meliloti]MQV38702.1 hypothetical protein [Sinorhizobium meliloti]